MKQKYWDRLESILTPDLDEIKNNLIVKENNQYNVFGNYLITPIGLDVEVKFKGVITHHFATLKSAVSWCIADKFRQYSLCQEIKNLDQDQTRLNDDINTTLHILKDLTNIEQKNIVEVKLQNKQLKLDLVHNSLLKCANRAKYWQIRGFNDEIARTRRQASNTTTRSSDRKSIWEKN